MKLKTIISQTEKVRPLGAAYIYAFISPEATLEYTILSDLFLERSCIALRFKHGVNYCKYARLLALCESQFELNIKLVFLYLLLLGECICSSPTYYSTYSSGSINATF